MGAQGNGTLSGPEGMRQFFSDWGLKPITVSLAVFPGIPGSVSGGDLFLYTNANHTVYRADPTTMQWTIMGSGQTNANVRELTVSGSFTNPILYACLSYAEDDRWRLMVNETGTWDERCTGLADGAGVRKVVPHPNYNNVCYALMDGLATPGAKVYESGDAGLSWQNISGGLPNVPMADLIVDPYYDQILYLGTARGVYRTIDGGQNGTKWNLGLPEAVVITEMRLLERVETAGVYYIVAGTYGRSMWRRVLDDPLSGVEDSPRVAAVSIRDAFPNPANPALTVRFATPKDGAVTVEIHDVRGHRVRDLLTAELPAGEHEVRWDGKGNDGRLAASGSYLAVVRTAAGMDSRKITVVK